MAGEISSQPPGSASQSSHDGAECIPGSAAEESPQRDTAQLSADRQRSLAQLSEGIVWTTTPDGRQEKELPEWQAFTGQTREGVAGFGWAEAIHPDDRDFTIERWQESIATGRTFEIEHRLRRWDGVYRDMLVRSVPVRDAEGSVREWIGVHTDITERKQLENALRQREQELTEAHRIAMLGTWHWTLADDSVTWSDEVYRVFGWDPKTATPGYTGLAQLHPPESRARLEVAVKRAIETGEPYVLDVEITRPDGTTRWITARGEVEAWADGKPVKLRGTIQEITERKLA